jgi:hypothetical protein
VRSLVAEVTARLGSALGPGWPVYPHGVPDRPTYPYVAVWSDVGGVDSDDLADSQAVRSITVWVSSVASDDQAARAGEQCAWASERALEALIGWRPNQGQISWKPTVLATLPPQRDDDIPGQVVYFCTTQFGFQINI